MHYKIYNEHGSYVAEGYYRLLRWKKVYNLRVDHFMNGGTGPFGGRLEKVNSVSFIKG